MRADDKEQKRNNGAVKSALEDLYNEYCTNNKEGVTEDKWRLKIGEYPMCQMKTNHQTL